MRHMSDNIQDCSGEETADDAAEYGLEDFREEAMQ